MGGTACHYSSYSIDSNGCSSSPDNSVLSGGAIAGIVIGSLLGIAVIIFLMVLTCKLLKRHNPSPRQLYYPNVYSVPTNMYTHQQPGRRSEMYIPPKSDMYSEAPTNNMFYENA